MKKISMLGITCEFCEITPQDAAFLLKQNKKNRPPMKHLVLRFSRIMVRNEWALTGQPIIFSDKDELLDGQHRLLGCIDSGVNIKVCIIRGIPASAFPHIDQGVKRTAGQVLAIDEVLNYNMTAMAAKLVCVYLRDPEMRGGSKNQIEANEIRQFVKDHPKIQDSVILALPSYKITSVGALAFVHWISAQIDERSADEFVEGLASGEGLTKGDPRLVLRNKLIANRTSKSRLKQREERALLIIACNKFYASETVQYVRWVGKGRGKQPFPKFVTKEDLLLAAEETPLLVAE